MKRKVYAIMDKAVGHFYAPFFAETETEARRNVITEMMNEDSKLAMHYADYELYYLAEFDDIAGKYEEQDTRLVMTGFEAKNYILKVEE